MDNSKKNEILLDAIIKTAFLEYIEEKCKTYPSNEELKELYPVPKSGVKRLKREIKRRQRKNIRVLPIILAVIITAITTFTIVVSLPAIGDYFRGNFDKNELHNSPDTGITNEKSEPLYDYDITYIPNGYTQREISESPNRGYYCYFDDNGRYIYISISLADRTSVSVEKDSFEFSDTVIKGRKCRLAYNQDNGYGTAIISDGDFTIQIDAITEKNEIIKIAEGMLKQEP